jgi:hypothetical protein
MRWSAHRTRRHEAVAVSPQRVVHRNQFSDATHTHARDFSAICVQEPIFAPHYARVRARGSQRKQRGSHGQSVPGIESEPAQVRHWSTDQRRARTARVAPVRPRRSGRSASKRGGLLGRANTLPEARTVCLSQDAARAPIGRRCNGLDASTRRVPSASWATARPRCPAEPYSVPWKFRGGRPQFDNGV